MEDSRPRGYSEASRAHTHCCGRAECRHASELRHRCFARCWHCSTHALCCEQRFAFAPLRNTRGGRDIPSLERNFCPIIATSGRDHQSIQNLEGRCRGAIRSVVRKGDIVIGPYPDCFLSLFHFCQMQRTLLGCHRSFVIFSFYLNL